MISGVVAGQMRVGSPAEDRYKSGAFTVNASGNASLTVPVGTASGDTLLVLLRCRADRSFTVPAGWTAHYSGVIVPLGNSENATDTKVYLLEKNYAGESALTFTHSAAAAHGAALVVVAGAILSKAIANGISASVVKTTPASSLIGIRIDNTTSGVSAAAAGYGNRGWTYFDSAGTHFFVGEVFTRASSATGSQTFAHDAPGGQAGAIILEIG